MKTAVVILNYNGAKMLRKFLPGVLKYSGTSSVIVADNASTDSSLDILRYEFPQVEVIKLNQNYGFAEGYNQALAQVEADYVVLLNSDVEVTENWLAPMESYLDEHPEVAACQPKLHSFHHKAFFEYAGGSGGFIDHYGYPYCRGRILGTVEEDKGQYEDVRQLFWATGAALMIRLEDYRKAGGLDGRFFAHMEEIDLCWRLRSRGRQIVCIPQSIVYHVGGATLTRDNPRKTYLNFRNNLLMLYKNLPEKELKSVMRVRCLLDYVAWLQYALKLDIPNAKAVLQARKDFQHMKADFLPNRRQNLEKSVQEEIPERRKFLLLWEYYIKGHKTFNQL